MKTAPIQPIVRDEVLDAIDAAGRRLTEATHADWPHDTRSRAAEALEWTRWAAELVRHDEHDSTLLLRIGGVIADLQAIAPQAPSGCVAAARRLRTASLLLQSARRAADLDARLRDILPAAQDIADEAREFDPFNDDAPVNLDHLVDLAQFIAIKARA